MMVTSSVLDKSGTSAKNPIRITKVGLKSSFDFALDSNQQIPSSTKQHTSGQSHQAAALTAHMNKKLNTMSEIKKDEYREISNSSNFNEDSRINFSDGDATNMVPILILSKRNKYIPSSSKPDKTVQSKLNYFKQMQHNDLKSNSNNYVQGSQTRQKLWNDTLSVNNNNNTCNKEINRVSDYNFNNRDYLIQESVGSGSGGGGGGFAASKPKLLVSSSSNYENFVQKSINKNNNKALKQQQVWLIVCLLAKN
jgi:hypothetical protein